MSIPIIATRIAERSGEGNPLESLHDAIAFSSADWGEARDLAWIYGIVLGWPLKRKARTHEHLCI